MNSRASAMPAEKYVFLAGEGSNELGSWKHKPPDQNDDECGILKALMEKVKDKGWKIKGAILWSKIVKYKAGDHRSAEVRNVLGACQRAIDSGCSILSFSRDGDGKIEQKNKINEGLLIKVEGIFPSLKIIGGCAMPAIEGWVLAFCGVRGTETFSKAKAEAVLSEKGISSKNTAQMVDFIQQCNRTDVAKDAECLNAWLTTAAEIL